MRQDMTEATSKYGTVRNFIPHRPEELRNSITEAELRLQQDNLSALAQSIDGIHGVKAICKHQAESQRTEDLWKTHWMVYKANSACPEFMTYFEEDPDRPVFDTNAPDYNKYVWTPVEICSPIFLWTQREEALATLTAVLQTINEQFDVVANSSTECHVHIGRADGKFYSLTTMKKLATIFWLSEPFLRALKDPKSPNNDLQQHYTWSYPLRTNSRIGMAINGQLPDGQTLADLYTGGPDAWEDFRLEISKWTDDTYGKEQRHSLQNWQALHAIWRAADHKELACMLRGPERKLRRLGFNFHAIELDASGESTPRTIEFRFLEGFIDEKVVPAWVRLCGELIGRAVADQVEGEDNEEYYRLMFFLVFMNSSDPLAPRNGRSAMRSKFGVLMQALGWYMLDWSLTDTLGDVVRKHYPAADDSPK